MTSTRDINFSVVLRRKRMLLVSGLVAACLAFAISKMLPLRYFGEGGMVVDSATEGGPVAPDEGTALVQTQIDVLQSSGLVSRVVRDLNLKQEPGLVPTMRLPAAVIASLTAVSDYVMDIWRSINDSAPVTTDDEHDQTVKFIQKQLQVEAKDHSKLVSIRFLAGSPDVASRVVNGVMGAYMSSDNEVRNDKVAKINGYIAQQSAAMVADIDAAQQKLRAFLQQHNLPEVGGGSTAAIQLSKDEEQLAVARDQLALRQAAYDTMSRGGSVQGAEETLESQTIQSLKNYEAQVTQQIGSLAPTDPRRYSLQAGLNSIRAQLNRENELIYASVARNVAIARAKVQSLEAAVRSESTRSHDVSVAGVEQKQLMSDLDAKRQLYVGFLTHAEQLRTGAERSASAHILFQAVPPQRPAATYGALSLIIGFIGGVFAAAGTLVLRDAFGTRVRSTLELELATGVPAFGSLPDLKQLPGGGVLAARRDTASAVIETFRAMWISMRSEQNAKGTAVVVTSSEIGEGKTTVATAMAQRFADDGFRVLLIDTDLRRPRLATMLGLRPDHFIEEVLTADVLVEQATARDTKFGFDCLLANGHSRNPAKLLLSKEFEQLLTARKQAYDFIILDSPPVLHVVDPVLLANLCEYILFVVEAGRVPSELVAEATRRFTDAERSRMLTLLTGVGPNKLDQRDYYSGYSRGGDIRLGIK
jgi:succinoglycan biosynthesis transport protein ExoP